MNFGKRLRYYAIGLLMGLVVSFMFFKNRGCAWLPGNRVMDAISSSFILRSDSIHCIMKCNSISDDDMYNMFYNGDVLFSESKVDIETEKVYVLQGERIESKTEFKIAFLIKDTISIITNIPNATACNCSDSVNVLRPVFMPDKMVQNVFRESDFQTTALADEEMALLKVDQKKVKDIIFNGTIIREKSNPFSKPHPYYTIKKDGYTVKVELAKKITRVLGIKIGD